MSRNIAVFVAAAALMAGTAGVGLAQSPTKNVTPGHEMQSKGPIKGDPGASGYSPGDQMKDKGGVPGQPGASGYAPGRRR